MPVTEPEAPVPVMEPEASEPVWVPVAEASVPVLVLEPVIEVVESLPAPAPVPVEVESESELELELEDEASEPALPPITMLVSHPNEPCLKKYAPGHLATAMARTFSASSLGQACLVQSRIPNL